VTRRLLGRLVVPAAAACVLTTTAAGCGGAGDGDEPDRTTALAHQAQQVGVALDIWSSSKGDLATELTPAVLDHAGVTLDDGVSVTDYATVQSGEPHPEPPVFDVRRLAQDLYDAMKDDSAGDEPALAVWGDGRTAGSNPKLRALVEEWLPGGWVTSRVDQRGWSAVQYCLTAPDGAWYYVRHSAIGRYGDTGRCRLDPDLPSVG
jgi:hypothetical protein